MPVCDAVLNSVMCIILHIQNLVNAFLCILGNMPSESLLHGRINKWFKTYMRTLCE